MPSIHYPHTEHLLRYVLRRLPEDRAACEMYLAQCQESIADIEEESIKSIGVASYDFDKVMVPYTTSDPTGAQVTRNILPDMLPEYREKQKAVKKYQRELREYNVMETAVAAIIEKVKQTDPAYHEGFVAFYRDGVQQADLAAQLGCTQSNVSKHFMAILAMYEDNVSAFATPTNLKVTWGWYRKNGKK